MKRRRATKADIRAARDIEVAAFVDQFTDYLERGPRKRESWEHAINPHRHTDEEKAVLVPILRGLASSIRAGLVE